MSPPLGRSRIAGRGGARRMKSAISLVLIAVLTGSGFPLTVHAQAETASPLARAATREAVRLAATQQGKPADAGWSRVRSLTPGTEILATRKNRAARRALVVVIASDSDLTVLD